jgi:hypothetical protein
MFFGKDYRLFLKNHRWTSLGCRISRFQLRVSVSDPSPGIPAGNRFSDQGTSGSANREDAGFLIEQE